MSLQSAHPSTQKCMLHVGFAVEMCKSCAMSSRSSRHCTSLNSDVLLTTRSCCIASRHSQLQWAPTLLDSTQLLHFLCRKRAEAEAAAAAIAEAEAALLAEQLAEAEAAEAAAQAAAAADAADQAEQEPLLAQESVPEAAGSPATADLLGMDDTTSQTEFNAAGVTASSVEVQVTSNVAAPAKLLESFSEELEELLPEIPSAVPSETPKPPVNAWAKPLTLANGQTPSAWQAATAPTPAEAAHQASAQALGLIPTAAQGRRPQPSQDAQTDAPGDVTPASWEEPVLQATQPKAQSQSWQGRQQGPPQRSDQPGWRRLPQPNDSGGFGGDGSIAPGDGLGMADRGPGRGRGRARGRARYFVIHFVRSRASSILIL